jgi:hypothetical protein
MDPQGCALILVGLIRIQEGKNDTPKKKKRRNFMFCSAGFVLFCGLEASPEAFMEA